MSCACVVLLAVSFANAQTPAGAAQPVHGHSGPAVVESDAGPYRIAKPLYAAFRSERALELLRFADGFYREPGNEGFDATIDRIASELRACGFGKTPGFDLQIIERPMRGDAWTPLSASLDLILADGKHERLLGFDEPAGLHRTMLPTNSRSADVTGRVRFSADDVEAGDILITDQSLSSMLRRVRRKKPGAVISSQLLDFNVDRSGRDRHLDAIHYGKVSASNSIPVAHISRRVYDRLFAASKHDPEAKVEFHARVKTARRPVRTIVATILGRTHPQEVVAIACHVQEPGAVDNGSGLSGFTEGARVIAELCAQGMLVRPDRSLAIIWGNEIQQSRIYLDWEKRRVIAAFSADMVGASRAMTGAIPLLERVPDPGAIDTIAPDFHTPWGAGHVSASDLHPNALATIARCALHDVGRIAGGGWETAEHPWEGGSDHDVFLAKGIPALLLWHFTDFAYHTNLDRLSHVDGESLKRVTIATLSAAYAIADPQSADIERYRGSVDLAEKFRVDAALAHHKDKTARAWRDWCAGAKRWLDQSLAPKKNAARR